MDAAALRAQLEQLHPVSYGWALACCSRNPMEAEDILQTAYWKVLDGRARYDGRAAFKTWLFAVIRRTAADERRRHWLRRWRLADYRQEPPEPPAPLSEMLAAALAQLPRRQREVLHLVFYQDLTIEAAAAVMGVAVGSARTHYERGKQRLRELLHEP
jgi:RNA polymerase sigma-70 factor (ECF subfamily)